MKHAIALALASLMLAGPAYAQAEEDLFGPSPAPGNTSSAGAGDPAAALPALGAPAIRQALSGLESGGDPAAVSKLLGIALALKKGPGNLTPADIQTIRGLLATAIQGENDPTLAAVLLQLDQTLMKLESGDAGLEGLEGLE